MLCTGGIEPVDFQDTGDKLRDIHNRPDTIADQPSDQYFSD